MYEQVEKPKENKSRAVANSVAQKKSNVNQSFGFVDNRLKSVVQRKLQSMKTIQRVELTLPTPDGTGMWTADTSGAKIDNGQLKT